MRHAEGRRGMGGEAAAVRPWAQIMGYSHIRILGCAVRIVGSRKSSGSLAHARALERWLPAHRAVRPAARCSPWAEPCRGIACSRTTLPRIGGFRRGRNPAVPSFLARLCVRSPQRARRGSQLLRVPQWSY